MSAAAGAAAAAAAAAKRQREEEEEMTHYDEQELADGWEFKIVRSATGMFKHPNKLRAVLEEERRAGWVLVEKFDNGRVRLKRPGSAKEGDGRLDLDPYRTSVGTSDARLAMMIIGGIFGVIALAVVIAGVVQSLAN